MKYLNHFQLLAGLALLLSSCSLDIAGLATGTLFNKIDSNTKMSQEQKQFAKRHYTLFRSIVVEPFVAAEKKGHWDFCLAKKSIWHLKYSGDLSFEEKVYIASIHKMSELWERYERVNADSLSEKEKQFLRSVHKEYGDKGVDSQAVMKNAKGRLTEKEKYTFSTACCFTEKGVLDDRILVLLYRLGGASTVPLSKAKLTQLTPGWNRKITGVHHSPVEGLVFTTTESDSMSRNPGSISYFCNRVACDETGQIKEIVRIHPKINGFERNKFVEILHNDNSSEKSWLWSAAKKQGILDHLAKSSSWIDDRIYFGVSKGEKIDIKLLISTKGTKSRIRDWWFIDTGKSKLLFVVACDFRFPSNTKHKSYMVKSNNAVFHRLQCYKYDNGSVTLLNEVAIDDENRVAAEIAFGVDKGEFYLWVVDRSRKNYLNVLSNEEKQRQLHVTKWNNGALSEWKECYRNWFISNLSIDPKAASAARISVRESNAVSRPSDMFFLLNGDKIIHKVLSYKGRYLSGHAYIDKTDTWAVFNWKNYREGYNVTFLDSNLNDKGESFLSDNRKIGYVTKSRLLYSENTLYLVLLAGEKKDSVYIREIIKYPKVY